MPSAFRIQLLGKTDDIWREGKRTAFIFNNCSVPVRLITNYYQNTLYLDPRCEMDVQNEVLHIRFANEVTPPKEEARDNDELVVVQFPISKVLEYGFVFRPID